MLRIQRVLLSLGLIGLATTSLEADDSREAAFERKVRPLLAKHCWSCHADEVQENGLRLDKRRTLVAGGERGPAIVSGKPDESLLIRMVRRSADLPAMPPDNVLAESEIEVLANWIREGAYWPSEDAGDSTVTREQRLESGKQHWAFQPVARPQVPSVVNQSWPRNDIDRFILARLESKGLQPTVAADRRTLARRIHFGLTGLPPSRDQLDQFVEDDSSDAVLRLVDELLNQPEYGEHWGRRWLDVARYADTTGYQEGAESQYPFSYTYRDYVIRSFNEDTPFNQFVLEQLAADQLELNDGDQWKLAGMGFLTTGPRFNYNLHEIIDDRIDTVTRGFLGLSVSCARCHDHKYDAILTDDYYGLYGVLVSSDEPNYAELPKLSAGRGDFSRYREFRELTRRRTSALVRFEREMHQRIQRELRNEVMEYLKFLVELEPQHRTISVEELNEFRYGLRGNTPYGPGVILRWENYLKQCGQQHPVFGIWNQLMALPPEQFTSSSQTVIEQAKNANEVLRQRLLESKPSAMIDVAVLYGEALLEADRRWRRSRQLDQTVSSLDELAWEELRQVLYGMESPIVFDEDRVRETFRDGEFGQFMELKRNLDSTFVEYGDVAAARAMVMVDRSEPIEPRVFIRGDATRPERTVERRFPRVLSAVNNEPFSKGSGRLELARNIADPSNPLTARVIVNRVWRWHFGRGLVETTSDFGSRGTPPSHPELLDYLAGWFVDNGWSLKKLHRLMMDSAVYQQSSLAAPALLEADPENRWFARSNRVRLGFESMRDSLLSVSNELVRREGGPPTNDFEDKYRSVYLLIDRQNMLGVRQAFDFPSPEFTSSRRPETTSPQQALFFLNSQFVHARINSIVDELAKQSDIVDSPEHAVDWLYERILARRPNDSERQLGIEFLGKPTGRARLFDLAHALVSSNEFLFID